MYDAKKKKSLNSQVRVEGVKTIGVRKHNPHPQSSDADWILQTGGARGVMIIVIGNGHGDTSSNPGRD